MNAPLFYVAIVSCSYFFVLLSFIYCMYISFSLAFVSIMFYETKKNFTQIPAIRFYWHSFDTADDDYDDDDVDI